MIELAPASKRGLAVASPVLLGAGSAGMGEATHAELDLAAFGGVVVGPLTRRSRSGSPTPRIAEVPEGILLNSGGQNRGLDATLRHHADAWARSPIPVIVQLIENDPRTLGTLAARLSNEAGVAALEWMPSPEIEARNLRVAIENMLMEGDLPVLLKSPYGRAIEWGRVGIEAGASALVVGAPPYGSTMRHVGGGSEIEVSGALHGPAVFPMMHAALVEIAAANLGVPLIAAGGIFSIEQAQTALDAGAAALQIDALVWIEPEIATAIARYFEGTLLSA
jgi:dihydroorotate dehydrogenase (NAD+) catalytic subunit